MNNSSAIGILSLIVAIAIFMFGDNIIERHFKQDDSSTNSISGRYDELIRKADNEIRKTPPNYDVALELYQEAFDLGNTSPNFSVEKAKQGILRCETELSENQNNNKLLTPTEADKSVELYFKREKNALSMAVVHDIMINHQFQGRLGNGDSLVVKINSGKIDAFLKANMLGFLNNVQIEPLEFLPNDKYVIEIEVRFSGFGYRIQERGINNPI